MISVVVPVYNSKDYLKRCLDSVVGQSFKDLEIICINDCSTDGSEAVLRDFERSDQRVRVISLPENHGCPYARNLGIDEARGEYIYFMDSDDWLDLDYLEEMHRHAVATGQDVVINRNWYFEFDERAKSRQNTEYRFAGDEGGFYPTSMVQSYFYPVVWARLYKLSYLRDNNIRSPLIEGGVEDNYFTSLAEILQPRSYIFGGPFYHYYQRQGSLSRREDRYIHYFQNFKAFSDTLRERGIAPSSAKRFYILYNMRIENEPLFNYMRSFFTEVESDVLEALELYRYYDYYVMESVLSCPDYPSYLSRFPQGIKFGGIDWEYGRMSEMLGPIRSCAGKVIESNARTLLASGRFDIFSNLFYIRNRRVRPRLARRVYREGFRAFVHNGDIMIAGAERAAVKRNLSVFDKCFDSFAPSDVFTPFIPVGIGDMPLDGSHLLASLAHLDSKVSFCRFASYEQDRHDYSFFLDHCMSRRAADLSAREGIDWFDNPKIACVCPVNDSEKIDLGRAFYSVDLNLGKRAFTRLMSKIGVAVPASVAEGKSKIRFVFLAGTGDKVVGSDVQIIEGKAEVRRVADLLLTGKGWRWFINKCEVEWRWIIYKTKRHLAKNDSAIWKTIYNLICKFR